MTTIQRIIWATILVTVFIYFLVKTESWLWIGIETAGFALLCRIYVAIDSAIEVDDNIDI